jgi:hypothetical protein
MKKALLSIATLCCGIVAMLLVAAPANAQATRTWVSGVGDDANPCSRTAPCKTFAGAISKTAIQGEINVLDPGGFGAVTITKAITISADHVEAGVLVSGTNGIVVAAGLTDVVVLQGLDIEGLGTGLDGIKVLSGLEVFVVRCKIHHFTGNGVNMNSNTTNSRVNILDSIIFQNATGVNINGAGVANTATIVNTFIDGNSTAGLTVNGAGNAAQIATTFLANTGTGNNLNLTNSGTAICIGPSNFIGGATTCPSSTAYK